MNWINKSVVYDFSGYYGFIYRIWYDDGGYYYGKKNFTSTRKKMFGKKRLAELDDNRLKKYEYITIESNWRFGYNGSTKNSKGKTVSKKEILLLGKTKRELTYLEAKLLFEMDVLNDEACLNENILGKFFKGNII